MGWLKTTCHESLGLEKAKPPYAGWHIQWCERLVNVKVGGERINISIYVLPD